MTENIFDFNIEYKQRNTHLRVIVLIFKRRDNTYVRLRIPYIIHDQDLQHILNCI